MFQRLANGEILKNHMEKHEHLEKKRKIKKIYVHAEKKVSSIQSIVIHLIFISGNKQKKHVLPEILK